jgi:hypothetical protein
MECSGTTLTFSPLCKQLILGTVSTLKSTTLQVAGSFTAIAWVWNVAIYKRPPVRALGVSLYVVSYLSRFHLLKQKMAVFWVVAPCRMA